MNFDLISEGIIHLQLTAMIYRNRGVKEQHCPYVHICIQYCVLRTKEYKHIQRDSGGIGDDDGGGGGDAVSYESVMCRENVEFRRRYIHCVLSLVRRIVCGACLPPAIKLYKSDAIECSIHTSRQHADGQRGHFCADAHWSSWEFLIFAMFSIKFVSQHTQTASILAHL